MPDVLSAVAALAVGNVSRAGRPVPGTVRVSGKTTLGTGFPISLTAMELHLCHAHWRACIQGLLFEMMRREKEASYNEDNTAFKLTEAGSEGSTVRLTHPFYRYVQ